jgi:hypothetical protein
MKKSVGRDDRLVLVDLIHGGIVGRLDADKQLFRKDRRSRFRDDLLEHGRRNLAAAAAAMGERREAQRHRIGSVHGIPRGKTCRS